MGHKFHAEHGREGPFPGVETVNIKDHFVMFEGGQVGKILQYLDEDGEGLGFPDAGDAVLCVTEHPDHGFFLVAIEPEPITFN